MDGIRKHFGRFFVKNVPEIEGYRFDMLLILLTPLGQVSIKSGSAGLGLPDDDDGDFVRSPRTSAELDPSIGGRGSAQNRHD